MAYGVFRPAPWRTQYVQRWIPSLSGNEAGVTIAGTLVTIKEGTLSITDRTEGRSVAGFTVLDPTGASHYTGNEVVSIRDWDRTLVFAGFVDTVREIRLAPDGYVIHEIACKDNWYLADKRFANVSYTSTAAGTIVESLRTTYLVAEGVTAGTISAGSSRTFDFSYITVAEALQRLAAAEGFIVNIDHNKRLQFHSRTAVSAAWNLTTADVLDRVTILRNNPRYRNRQIVTGGYTALASQTEIQAGDDEKRVFVMPYPLASAPTVDISGGSGGTWQSQTVGQLNVDTGKDFYWSPGSREIVQDSSEVPVPTPGPSGTQTARPTSDVSSSGWVPSVNPPFGTQYTMIDEATIDDADYVETVSDTPDTYEYYTRFGLATLTDPSNKSNHVVTMRAKKKSTSQADVFFVRLRNSDDSLIKQWVTGSMTTSFVNSTFTLTQSEADGITSYTGLRLEFSTGTRDAASRYEFVVSQAYLTIPAAGGPDPPPAGIGWLRVQFTARKEQTIEVEDAAEIAAVAAIEGGSGKVEAVYAAPGQEATPIANALLARYGKRGRALEFSTLRSGLVVGANLNATLADHDITTATDFLIEAIRVRHRGTWNTTQEFVYTVEASENVLRGRGEDLISSLFRQSIESVEAL